MRHKILAFKTKNLYQKTYFYHRRHDQRHVMLYNELADVVVYGFSKYTHGEVRIRRRVRKGREPVIS